MTPNTSSKWVDAIRSAQTITERLDLVKKRPIIVWFQENRKEIRRLIKISSRTDEDIWMIHGRETSDSCDSLSVKLAFLDVILYYLTPEQGWVRCEFESEIEFYTEALRYLQEE